MEQVIVFLSGGRFGGREVRVDGAGIRLRQHDNPAERDGCTDRTNGHFQPPELCERRDYTGKIIGALGRGCPDVSVFSPAQSDPGDKRRARDRAWWQASWSGRDRFSLRALRTRAPLRSARGMRGSYLLLQMP